MERKTTHLTARAALLVLVLALAAPSVARGAAVGVQGPAGPAHVLRFEGTSRVTEAQQTRTATGRGLGWREAAIGGGILLGVLLLGLYGDVAVGAVIAGAALLGKGAAFGARRLWATRLGVRGALPTRTPRSVGKIL